MNVNWFSRAALGFEGVGFHIALRQEAACGNSCTIRRESRGPLNGQAERDFCKDHYGKVFLYCFKHFHVCLTSAITHTFSVSA